MFSFLLSAALASEPKGCVIEVFDAQTTPSRSRGCPEVLPPIQVGKPESRLGSWPHPTVISVDGKSVRRYRITPRGRARAIPVARVLTAVEPVFPVDGDERSCVVNITVDEQGSVTTANPVDCAAAREVEEAATVWRFRPYSWDDEPVSFSTSVVIRWSSPLEQSVETPQSFGLR